jgi:hypothetical protein
LLHRGERDAEFDDPGGAMTDELPPPLSFRMRVIALLWERGWPEYGLDDDDCVVWRGEGGSLLLEGDEPQTLGVEYEVADGEGGYLSFRADVSVERVVEAIDRLRWVIGVPARVGEGNLAGCLPPLIPPEGAAEALAAAKAEYRHALRPGMGLEGPPPGEPLRSGPAAKEDPAYVPTRWIVE